MALGIETQAHPTHQNIELVQLKDNSGSARESDHWHGSASLNEIARRAETRLQTGDSSFPTSALLISADVRASSMTSTLASGKMLFSEIVTPSTSENPITRYNELAHNATSHTINEEQTIAKDMWNSSSDAERQQMIKEQKALSDYKYDLSPTARRPETPALEAFQTKLAEKLAPLEQRRSAQIAKVWDDLPQDAKREIFVREEMQRELRQYRNR